MKQKLLAALQKRIESELSPQNPVKFLKSVPIDLILNTSISIVYLYTREKKGAKTKSILFTEVISAIGHSIRTKSKLKKDSALAAKAGAFVLYSYEMLGMISLKMGTGANGHGTYLINVLNDDAIVKLWEGLPDDKAEKLPSVTPFAPWVSSKHPCGMTIVKTTNKDTLEELTPESHPIVFDTLNKAQSVGWQVNKDLFPLVNWALRNKVEAFADIWEIQNDEAKRSKLREATAVAGIAKRFIDAVFYHLYYYDFRGRKYAATAYFHEQGSDLAKGLLLRSDSKEIGIHGFEWLLISIASNWAGDAGRPDGIKTDKIPLRDRIKWAVDNEEILLDYAENPKVNQGWMKADKPWQFLAACNELMKLRVWQVTHAKAIENGLLDEFDYCSHLECYIDGSNNGSQHLSALTRDEITAPHVNLVPLDLPGDLYKYVADHVWHKLGLEVAKLTKEEYRECESVIDDLVRLKQQINNAPMKSDLRKDLIDELKAYRTKNEEIIALAAAVFWHNIRDAKHKRKVVKRNVMTLPYGGTAYGLGQQQIDDARKHGIESLMTMEHRWGSYMGRKVFEDCKESLKRPMQLLSLFEQAGKDAEARGEFLSWHVPITNFPVVQTYVEGVVKKIWVQYGPPLGEKKSTGYYENTYQLAVCFLEELKMSKHRQAQGAAPNAIHSLDAAHLMLTVHRADFPITTIHDSFGCLLADMPKLFTLIRQTFVELYASDPLTHMMSQLGVDITKVEIGTLDINNVLESEYCFV